MVELKAFLASVIKASVLWTKFTSLLNLLVLQKVVYFISG